MSKSGLLVDLNKENRPNLLTLPLLTPEQIMQLFQISRSTFNRWIKNGTLKAIKPGGVIRVPQSSIQSYFDAINSK